MYETPDGHNDLLILLRFFYHNKIYSSDFKDRFEEGGLQGHVDAPRLDSGKVGGAFWSAFMPCPKNVSDFSDENYAPCMSDSNSAAQPARALFSQLPPLS